MSESDGIGEAAEGTLRAGLMAAARIGEQLARLHAQEQRAIHEAEAERARELRDRFEASRTAARAQLDPVSREDWWAQATAEMIERAYETAAAWKDLDAVAAGHEVMIREQVRRRYGIEMTGTGAGDQGIPAALERARQAQGRSETERSAAAADSRDAGLAAAAVAGANREDASREASGRGPRWDSPGRRAGLAAGLALHPDREAVKARLVADTHQGTPPGAAVQPRSLLGQSGTAKMPGGRSRSPERGGPDRRGG